MKQARPRLELLEARNLLATLLWNPAATVDLHWSVAGNWIDLATGGVLWSHTYREKGDEIDRPAFERALAALLDKKPLPLDCVQMPDGKVRSLIPGPNSPWQVTPPMVRDGKVILTPPDSRSLFCLDLKTGKRT